MSIRKIAFFDGYSSSTTPTEEPLNTNSLVTFVNSAAYEAVYGTGVEGSIFANTTTNTIYYHNGTSWVDTGDHTSLSNIGTRSHAEIDSDIDDLEAALVTDHGDLTGLSDDDHDQYALLMVEVVIFKK